MSEQDQQPPEEVPEGMIRKKRKVRRKRRSSSSSKEKEASKLFSKAKELLIGMHDEEDDYGHVDVAEQLRRLKNRDSDDDKPLDDVWGTKKRSSSWLWILLVGIIVPVVAIMIGIVKLTGNEEAKSTGLVDKENLVVLEREEFDTTEGPLSWYHADTTGVIGEVRSIIHAINEAKEPGEIAGLLRKSPYRQVNPIDLADWGKDCLTNSLSGFHWEGRVASLPGASKASGTGYLVVSGTRRDFSSYQAYFVHQDGRVVLDWEASTGWSEKSIGEIAETKPRKDILVRCLLEKRPVYEFESDGVEYSGYFVSSPDLGSRILAYNPLNNERNLETERELKSILNYGGIVIRTAPQKNRRVTLKIRHRSGIGEEGVFEIAEFEYDGWLSP